MQLRELPALCAYAASVLCGLVGAVFWVQYFFGTATVTGLSNVLLFAGLTATLGGLGYVFELGESRW